MEQSQRQQLIKNLQKSLDMIYRLANKQEEIEEEEKKIPQIEQQANAMDNGCGTIFVTLFSGVLVFSLTFFILDSNGMIESLDPIKNLTSLLIVFLVPIIYVIVMLKCVTLPNNKKKKQKAQEYLETELPKQQKIIQQKKDELEALVNSEQAAILVETIPEDYASVDAVSSFILYIKNQRADSLKEAINLYEEELHRQQMIEMQQEQLATLETSVQLSQAQYAAQQQMLAGQKALLNKTRKISKQVRFSNAMGIINTVRHWNKK